MEKLLTISLSVFGALAVVGGWIFALGVLWQQSKELKARMDKTSETVATLEEDARRHVMNTNIHRDPDRDNRELELLRREVHSIREDIKNLPAQFVTLFQSLHNQK